MALNDLQKFRAEMLAKFGGFSHRFIAAKVNDKRIQDVTDEEKKQISSYLSKHKIKLKWWRDGRTAQAQAYANQRAKIRRRRYERRKAG